MGVLRVGVCAWAMSLGLAWGQATKPPVKETPPPVKEKGDVIMTPAQAKELLASVDEIMGFAAKDTGLAGVLNVKRRLVTRDEVNRYLIKSFDEDESSKRLQRSVIVLKK